MNRRIALQRIGVLLGTAVSASTASALMAGCRGPEDPAAYVPNVLTGDLYRFVQRLGDSIIPETDTPGATAAGVPEFIDVILTGFYPQEESTALSTAIRRLAEDLATKGFDEADARIEVVGALDEDAFADQHTPWQAGEEFSHTGCYRRLKELIVSGYYTSQVGATVELRMNPMGPFRGDVPMNEIERAWA